MSLCALLVWRLAYRCLGLTLCAGSRSSEWTIQLTIGQPGKEVVWLPTPQALFDKMLDMAKYRPSLDCSRQNRR
jgi:hypothetical protein